MKWRTDWNLRVRMLASVVLFLGINLALVIGVFSSFTYFFPWFLTNLPDWFVDIEVPYGTLPSVWVILGLTAFLVVAQIVYTYRKRFDSVRGYEVSEDEYPELHEKVERLALAADIPKPRVAVVESDVPNAFTEGKPTASVIVVTTSLLEILTDEELETVLAHEIAHIKNYDAQIMTTASVLPGATYSLTYLTYSILKKMKTLANTAVFGIGAVIFVILLVTSAFTFAFSVFFWVSSLAFFRVLSRYREYAADRGAVAITGEPGNLATALRKIDGSIEEIPSEDLREQDGGMRALCIFPAPSGVREDDISDRILGWVPEPIAKAFSLSEDEKDDVYENAIQKLFPSTHPRTQKRIEKLEEIVSSE